MNSWHGLAAVLALGLGGCAAGGGEGRPSDAPHEQVRHVVLFKFKDDAPPDRIREIEKSFRALKDQIPEILAFEWGTNMSPENRAEGFTHCFFLTFRNAAARDAYLPHPAHKAFGAQLRPYLDKVLVIDYVTHS
jgi:hypothetical protein